MSNSKPKTKKEIAAKRKKHKEQRQIAGLNRAPVSIDRLAPDNSFETPDFVARGFYVDRTFTCVDCVSEHTWTATQQKWWYEVAKGSVWTCAKRCRACPEKGTGTKSAGQAGTPWGAKEKRAVSVFGRIPSPPFKASTPP